MSSLYPDTNREIDARLVESFSSRSVVSSSAKELYERAFVKPADLYSIELVPDMRSLAIAHAASTVAKIQFWQRVLPQGDPINILWATGKTQLFQNAAAREYLQEVRPGVLRVRSDIDQDVHQIFVAQEADISQELDMNRVKSFHLDTFLFQSRSARFSYAKYVSATSEIWKVPDRNTRLFYGDVKIGNKDPSLILEHPEFYQLTGAELDTLTESVRKEGSLIEEFLAGSLPESHLQYSYFRDQQRYFELVVSDLQNNGGAHIINCSFGGSYTGEPHIAFVEAEDLKAHKGNPWAMSAFMGIASYHAAAGNYKSNGGMYKTYTRVDGKRLPTATVFTLGPKELRGLKASGGDTEFHPTVSIVVNGDSKAFSVKRSLEEPQSPSQPSSMFHDIGNEAPRGKGTYVLDEAAFRETLLASQPWLFTRFTGTPSQEVQNQFFINISRLLGCKVSDFTEARLLQSELLAEVPEATRNMIADTVTYNLRKIVGKQPLGQRLQETCQSLADKLVLSEDIASYLRISPGDVVDVSDPHFDDSPLVMNKILKSMAAVGNLHSSVQTPGHSAVQTEYVARLLEVLEHLPGDEFEELRQRSVENAFSRDEFTKELLQNLVTYLESGKAPTNSDPSDHYYWEQLAEEELVLRAKLNYVALQGAREECWQPALRSQAKIGVFRELVSVYHNACLDWNGNKDLAIVEDLKVASRLVENQTQFLSLGVPYENVPLCVYPSWYTGGPDRETIVNDADIDAKLRDLESKHAAANAPHDSSGLKAVVSNGEWFLDGEAHCLTQLTTMMAIVKGIERGTLSSDMRLLFYQGVWKRLAISGNDKLVLVALSEAELQDQVQDFLLHYRCQAPALVPDASTSDFEFFCDRVYANAKTTLDEYKALMGDNLPQEFKDVAGILAFEIWDLSMDEQRQEFFAETKNFYNRLMTSKDMIEQAGYGRIIGESTQHARISKVDWQRLQITAESLGVDVLDFLLVSDEVDELNACRPVQEGL